MKNADFTKGIAIGITAGAAAGMILSPKRKMKKSLASKALHVAGDMVDGLSGMLKG